MNHLANAPCHLIQKTRFQNPSPFSHSSKMFQWMSTQENSEIRNIGQFFADMVSQIWSAFPGHLIFWCETFFTTLLRALQNYKIPEDSIQCTLGQKKCNFCIEYRIWIGCNGIWAVLRIPKCNIPLDFRGYRENGLTFLNRVFCDLFQILMIKYGPAGGGGDLTFTQGHKGSQCIHGAFLLRLSVVVT